MVKPSIEITEDFASAAKIADDIPREDVIRVLNFLQGVSISDPVPDEFDARKDTYSDIIRDLLKPLHISRGRVTCLVSVKPAVTNFYSGFHGGAIAAVAEVVAVACARTVVANDKELFLGELSISYLSSATKNAVIPTEMGQKLGYTDGAKFPNLKRHNRGRVILD
ncbi:acyl-coenzyme A thioesterase 13-like [Pyrus ussuriensis x Pyrus communis]|uniref:Acyl-coenzyme A thioesterase 13-like n=1 Tax=Pyrus ussuriensis x Pyrus communis TaxID=2448454 RepID=A0A5N5FAR6_9ROSA|nr:acyl-coenzyme A thioesterase 13-like [Pyrus ussuriensis x Pyrus communis]